MDKPKNGTTWGTWQYNEKRLTLTYSGYNHYRYEIDLEECDTSAEVLDHIFQVQTKAWASSQVLGDLVIALSCILQPQATLCSNGAGKQLDVKWFLQGV